MFLALPRGRPDALTRRRAADHASALVVPVQEAEHAVAAWPGDPASLKASGMPFHVTALYPFLPEALIDTKVELALAQIAATRMRFEFQLGAVGRFEGVLFI